MTGIDSRPTADVRNGLLCAAVSTAALLLAWPFAASAFNDDWTWAFTVRQLLRTGRLTYNGWSSPSVIAHAYWGLLWVKAFGFSFNALRVSTIPLAAGAVGLAYALARRAGLPVGASVLAALTLGLSPLYMPLESSFMTDVPGLFFLELSLYALVRAVDAAGSGRAVGWIAAGSAAALVGGSTRQLVWVVPLAVLPYVAWLRRTDRSAILAAVVGWTAVFAGAVAIQRWVGRQPFSVPDPPLGTYVRFTMHHPRLVARRVFALGLTAVLFLLPVAVMTFRRPWGIARLAVAVILFVAVRHTINAANMPRVPWMENILTPTGVLGSVEVYGDRPEVLTRPVRRAVAYAVAASVSMLAASAGVGLATTRGRAVAALVAAVRRPEAGQATVVATLLTLAAVTALELTRSVFNVAYDRHLIAVGPLLAILLLWAFHQWRPVGQVPWWSWAVLAIFGGYAVASTQELCSLQRAQVTALGRLAAAGIDSTRVDAGFEREFWTEVVLAGHINDPRIANAPGVYDPTQPATPHKRTDYVLEVQPNHGDEPTVPTRFGSVPYFSLLPPFRRAVHIDRFTDPWWLDVRRTTTRPVAKSHLPPELLDAYGIHY